MSDQNINPTGDDDDDIAKEMAQYEELFRSKVDDVETAGRRVGLYVRDIGLSMAPDFGRDDMGAPKVGFQPAMVANFTVGDAAWSDRVQNAEQYTTEAEFRKMAVQTEREKFEETKAELERRLREGKDILGGDDDDGEESHTP